ncbi:hypothetical protein [Streptomyces sp. NPDC059142]|uniref:hypothetical protein n=1 Tax=Streptomyces sp. NPDC059142 TaxID=3346739 RepID=UPI0036C77E51
MVGFRVTCTVERTETAARLSLEPCVLLRHGLAVLTVFAELPYHQAAVVSGAGQSGRRP